MPRPLITEWTGVLFRRQLRAVLDWLDAAANYVGYGGVTSATPTALLNIGIGWRPLEADAVVLSQPVNLEQVVAQNAIRPMVAGIWMVNITFSISHNELNASRETGVRVYDIDAATGSDAFIVGVGRNTDATTFGFSQLFEIATPGESFRVEVGGGDPLTSVVLNSFTLSANLISAYPE